MEHLGYLLYCVIIWINEQFNWYKNQLVHKGIQHLHMSTVIYNSYNKPITRNSSGDEIANVNFLYDDIVHVLQNTIDSCINSATDRRGGWVLERMFTKFSAMQRPLRRSRLFKVTDIGTNRKLIYDFLLVINSNLPPILHRFQVMVQFSLARGECLTLTLSLGVIPCQYRHKWYITKNLIFWSTFLPQKVSMYLQPLLRNPFWKLPNSVKLRRG